MALSRSTRTQKQVKKAKQEDAARHRAAYAKALEEEDAARIARWASRELSGANQRDALEKLGL